LRRFADSEGVEILGIAANNDFSNPVPEVREAQICFVHELIRMMADMGAKHLRVFLAWWGITRHPKLATYDIAEGYWPIVMRSFPRKKSGIGAAKLIECARYAGEMGSPARTRITSHSSRITDVIRMVREVNSPHLQICLDAPLMPDRSAAAMMQAAKDVGFMQVMSHFGGEFERNPDGSILGMHREDGVLTESTNQYYLDFAKAMHSIGYKGYTSYELCHQLPVVDGETVGIEFAHHNARLAAEFMREIIREAYSQPVAKPAASELAGVVR
jgi:sugar phosphate isomerase/epimerase